MLGWVYRNLSEEQPSVGSALQKAENPRCRQRGFFFCMGGCRPLVGTHYFSAACTNGGVTSTPVCSAAV